LTVRKIDIQIISTLLHQPKVSAIFFNTYRQIKNKYDSRKMAGVY